MSEFEYDVIVQRSEEQMSCMLDGEIVLLSIEKGSYYNLNSTGLRVWELMESPTSVDQICTSLIEEYEITKMQCLKEVQHLLNQLEKKNLILIH